MKMSHTRGQIGQVHNSKTFRAGTIGRDLQVKQNIIEGSEINYINQKKKEFTSLMSIYGKSLRIVDRLKTHIYICEIKED